MGNLSVSFHYPQQITVEIKDQQLQFCHVPQDLLSLQTSIRQQLTKAFSPTQIFLFSLTKRKSKILDDNSYKKLLKKFEKKHLKLTAEIVSIDPIFSVPQISEDLPEEVHPIFQKLQNLLMSLESQIMSFFLYKDLLFQQVRKFSRYIGLPSVEKAITHCLFSLIFQANLDMFGEQVILTDCFPYINISLGDKLKEQHRIQIWDRFVLELDTVLPALDQCIIQIKLAKNWLKHPQLKGLKGHFQFILELVQHLLLQISYVKSSVLKTIRMINKPSNIQQLVRLGKLRDLGVFNTYEEFCEGFKLNIM